MTEHTTPHSSNQLSKTRGAWGFRDDKDNDALRVDGRPKGRIRPLNAHGRSYGPGDRVGLLVDMDKGTLQFLSGSGRLLAFGCVITLPGPGDSGCPSDAKVAKVA